MGNPILVIGDGIRLQQFIHHASLSNIQSEKILFCQAGPPHQPVIPNLKGMHGVIFTERALVNTAIRENKKILGNVAGTFKRFVLIKKYFWVDNLYTAARQPWLQPPEPPPASGRGSTCTAAVFACRHPAEPICRAGR